MAKANRKSRKICKAELLKSEICRTQREAAKYANVSCRTIRRWISENMLVAVVDNKRVYLRSQLDFFKRNEGRQPTEAKTKGIESDARYKDVRAKLIERVLDEKDGLIEKRAEEMIIPKILAMKRGVLSLERTIPAVVPKEHQQSVRKAVRREVRFMIKSLFNL